MSATITIGDQVKQRRKALDLTQDQLAEKTGVAQGTISKLERGELVPSLQTLRKLRDGLELDEQTWLDWIDAA